MGAAASVQLEQSEHIEAYKVISRGLFGVHQDYQSCCLFGTSALYAPFPFYDEYMTISLMLRRLRKLVATESPSQI